jgi:hypothetical protein
MKIRAFEDCHVIDGSLEPKDTDIYPALLVDRNVLDVEGSRRTAISVCSPRNDPDAQKPHWKSLDRAELKSNSNRHSSLHPPYSAGRTFAVVLVFLFALEDEVLRSFVKHSVVRLALPKGVIINVALSLHLLHLLYLLLTQLLDVEELVIAELEDGLLDPGTVDIVRSVVLLGVTLADVRAVGSSKVSDTVTERGADLGMRRLVG